MGQGAMSGKTFDAGRMSAGSKAVHPHRVLFAV